MAYTQPTFREPVTFLFAKMWQFAKGHRKRVVSYLALSAAANIIVLAEPLIFGEFINEIQRNGLGEHNIGYLILVLLAFLGVEIAFWIFHWPARILENLAAFRTEANYRLYLISGVLNLGLSWHAPRDSGDTIDKVNKASDALFNFSADSFVVVEVLIKAIGTTAVLLFFNVYIGLMALAILVVAFLVLYLFDRRLVPQYKQLNEFDNKISARVFDALSNITTVKVLHIENPVFSGVRQAAWNPFTLFGKNKRLSETKWFAGSMLFTLLVVLPLLFYVLYLHRYGLAVEIGTISAMYLYLSRLTEVYFTFASHYEEMIINKTSILNAADIEASFVSSQHAAQTAPNWQRMVLENVSFAYEDTAGDTRHIKDASLEVARGERIALIGESGSGKTTFLKILHGMYPTAKGHVSFDDAEPLATNFTDLDFKTTLVPQEPEVFSASIRENITLGLEYSDEDIFQAADLAGFTNVVHQLPQGLESSINEKGVNLSGGQKQRLALTRALLFAGNREIILLDESTSSVDPETEVKIYQHIFAHFSGRTFLASVHKMNLLKYFDRIVMFENGAIVDAGTFDDLYARNSKFKASWDEYIAEGGEAA